MSPEERERFKEKEKAHLRELRRLKTLARQVKRRGALNKALNNITSALESVMDTDDVASRVDYESIKSEARMELALERESLRSQSQSVTTPGAANIPVQPSKKKPVSAAPPEPMPKTKTIGPYLHTQSSDSE